MNKITITAIAIVSILAIVLGLGPVSTPQADGLSDTEREIQFFSDRLETQPADIISATRLGVAYRQRQRETTDVTYLYEAEDVLRHGLEMLPGYAPTELALARVLIDLHRFQEALTLAQSSNKSDPQPEAALAIGDALLAMGELDEAEAVFGDLAEQDTSPPLMARLARVAELRGNIQSAIELMEDARDRMAVAQPLGEPTAWFSTRLADLYLSSGEPDEGENMFRLALAALPDYAPAVAGLAEVALADGDIGGAIAQYERATVLATDPAWLFALSDLNRMIGREDVADQYLDAALATVDQFGSIHPRDFALFYAGASRPDRALEFATRALEQSRDVYAQDVMAFALHSAGRNEEAWSHMQKALALGTIEPAFDYHAGAILLALGETDLAVAHLERALSTGLDPWDQELAYELLRTAEVES